MCLVLWGLIVEGETQCAICKPAAHGNFGDNEDHDLDRVPAWFYQNILGRMFLSSLYVEETFRSSVMHTFMFKGQ